MLKYITGGFCALFLLLLLYFLFRIWQEGKRERCAPKEIPGEALSADIRENALRSLRVLSDYYKKRDPEKADECINETMLPEEILILGTNPGEVFHGREGAKNLLQGDWKYWGKLCLDAEQTVLSAVGSALYFVLRGQVKLDRFRFRVPIKVTGTLEERDGQWRISKMQFVNDLNTNYLIFAWSAALFMLICLLLFGLSFIIK